MEIALKSSKIAMAVAALSFFLAAPALAADVTIEGNDQMQYSIKEFKVKAGESVKLTLKHVGQLPKLAMGHNVVILKADADVDAFLAAAAGAYSTDYFPESEKDKVIANTSLVGGGESSEVEFTAPAAGKYVFLCTFPGHNAMMRGEMIVE